MWDTSADKWTQVAAHDAPIKEMFWVADKNVLVTGSWDKTLKYWDLRRFVFSLFFSYLYYIYIYISIKEMFWVADKNVLVIGSWDKTFEILGF